MADSPPPPIKGRLRAPLFLFGVLLFLVGPLIIVVQLWQGYLGITPWYVPALATLGVLCMCVGIRLRPSVLRGLVLAVFMVVCGLEWLFFGVMARTPDYDGPATAGNGVPTFLASRADGAAFTNADLEAGKPTILLFFRGHW